MEKLFNVNAATENDIYDSADDAAEDIYDYVRSGFCTYDDISIMIYDVLDDGREVLFDIIDNADDVRTFVVVNA